MKSGRLPCVRLLLGIGAGARAASSCAPNARTARPPRPRSRPRRPRPRPATTTRRRCGGVRLGFGGSAMRPVGSTMGLAGARTSTTRPAGFDGRLAGTSPVLSRTLGHRGRRFVAARTFARASDTALLGHRRQRGRSARLAIVLHRGWLARRHRRADRPVGLGRTSIPCGVVLARSSSSPCRMISLMRPTGRPGASGSGFLAGAGRPPCGFSGEVSSEVSASVRLWRRPRDGPMGAALAGRGRAGHLGRRAHLLRWSGFCPRGGPGFPRGSARMGSGDITSWLDRISTSLSAASIWTALSSGSSSTIEGAPAPSSTKPDEPRARPLVGKPPSRIALRPGLIDRRRAQVEPDRRRIVGAAR